MAITITAPQPNTPIRRDEDVQIFIVANVNALKRAVLAVEFPGLGRTEQIHNGTAFLSPFTAGLKQSYSDVNGAGFQYLVRRTGGWPDNPLFRIVAYDVAGGESVI